MVEQRLLRGSDLRSNNEINMTQETYDRLHASKPKSGDIMKFGDMPSGTLFQETKDNPRKFVKLLTHYPMIYEDGNQKEIQYWCESDNPIKNFNSVDFNGSPSSCPDWLEFEVFEID